MVAMQMIEKIRTTIGLTSFQLKLIALFFMTVDHVASTGLAMFLGASNEVTHIMHIFGRTAAPIFLFIIVQGVRHTRNKLKYVLRLYIAGVLVQIANWLFERNVYAGSVFGTGNIFPTLMYTALYIFCIERLIYALKNKKYGDIVLSLGAVIVPLIFTEAFRLIQRNTALESGLHDNILLALQIFVPPLSIVMFSYLFVLLGIAWYFINQKLWNCLIFVALSVVCGLVNVDVIARLPYHLSGMFELFADTQWWMVLAIPFIALYNGKKGRSCKYLFYVYYPMHQYVLLLLSNCFM
jgi:hypothetical protein